ncbi:hypothetical protein JCM11251_002032 [Rhodosporidiobolus azoricus]
MSIDLNDLIPCNATMVALVESAVGLPHSDIGYEQTFSAGYCQYSSNATLAAEAKDVWVEASAYGYIPSKGFAAFALAAFAIAVVLHIYQLIRSRRWFYIATLLGAALQIFGWTERFLAADDVQVGYVEQLATLTIAPTFFSATIYALFSMLTASQDPTLLPFMSPKKYMWCFIVVDFVTLVIQAAGGAIAAITDDQSTFEMGCNIMLAGIILQLITTLIFLTAFSIYYHRLRAARGNGIFSLKAGTGRIFWGIVLMAAFIIVRGCYRTAELSEGLFGDIATHEAGLIACDAIPMIFVIFLLSATHPLHNIPRTSTVSYATPAAVEGNGRYEMQPASRPASQNSQEKMLAVSTAEQVYGRA